MRAVFEDNIRDVGHRSLNNNPSHFRTYFSTRPLSRLSPQEMQSANSLYKSNQQHDQNFLPKLDSALEHDVSSTKHVHVRLACTVEQKALAKMNALKFASWTSQVSHGNAPKCQDTKSICGVKTRAAWTRNLQSSKRNPRLSPCSWYCSHFC